jgi:RNase P subunit RPR2
MVLLSLQYCWKCREELEYTKSVEIREAKHETQRTILLTTMRYQVSLPTDRGTSFCTLVHNSLIEEAFVAIRFD